ncbi:hypothetical protein PEKONANI_01454 [Aeromonas jandaei]
MIIDDSNSISISSTRSMVSETLFNEDTEHLEITLNSICSARTLENIDFFYRLQKIVATTDNKSGFEVVGYEFLLNFAKAKMIFGQDGLDFYEEAILTGKAIINLVRLIKDVYKNLRAGTRLFINIERRDLCDVQVLTSLVELSNKLYIDRDIELVVEITERNNCSDYFKFHQALHFLAEKKVSLAVDDYDIYNGDFREKEVFEHSLYTYVKINMPHEKDEQSALKEFLRNNEGKRRVIVERVEYDDDLKVLSLLPLFGFQGFLFDGLQFINVL